MKGGECIGMVNTTRRTSRASCSYLKQNVHNLAYYSIFVNSARTSIVPETLETPEQSRKCEESFAYLRLVQFEQWIRECFTGPH